MSLKDTVEALRTLLASITVDLEKAVNGNKAAAQRVRTVSIRFEKVAKAYRKESIRSEKSERNRKTSRAKGRATGSKAQSSSSSRKGTAKTVSRRSTFRR
ncbi:histone [Candidatus Similichlamydia epinepheli]|uniref:histone H1-like protein HctA n=1 Tax=Candidatus Similichlamydia epinepheli TaxID=1903953 RepID=UPI000D3BC183|nr:histone [Candidatus Similichlamydia epinepheli]